MKNLFLSLASLALIMPLTIRPTGIEDCANPDFSFRPAHESENYTAAVELATSQFCTAVAVSQQ